MSFSANLRNHLLRQRPFMRGILNMVRSDIAVSGLESGTLTHAFTNLNAYKETFSFVSSCPLLSSSPISSQISGLYFFGSTPRLLFALRFLVFLNTLYNLLLNVAPQSSQSVLIMSAIALIFSRPQRDHPQPLSLSVFLSYWRRTLEKVYCGNLVKANVLC